MATTYEAIATVTVGSGGAANITFSSIPATYTDLLVKISSRCDYGEIDQAVFVRFNGDSAANYSIRELLGNGSVGVSSLSWSSQTFIFAFQGAAQNATSNTFGNIEMYIPNYAGSTNKSVSVDGVTETNASSGTNRLNSLSASLWSNTSAITSIALTSQNGSFVQYSTATLYGIKNS
jgi:hypothetical protein